LSTNLPTINQFSFQYYIAESGVKTTKIKSKIITSGGHDNHYFNEEISNVEGE
jgi:hypothetical protein